MSCLMKLGVATVAFIAPMIIAPKIVDECLPPLWHVAKLDETVILETDGTDVAWYESASYGTVFELVSEDDRAVQLPVVTTDRKVVDGRTFVQFSETTLASGTYELRFTPSPFASQDALVAYGDTPQRNQKVLSAAVGAGFLVGAVLAVLVFRV